MPHPGGGFDALSHPEYAREQDRRYLAAVGLAHPELIEKIVAAQVATEAKRKKLEAA